MVFNKKSFSGGIFFRPDIGHTDSLPIELFPAPPAVTIPLIQNTGAPAQPTVKVGDHVAMGQIIGEADTAPVHASVSGVVTDISRYPYARHPMGHPMSFSVTIENNGNDEFASPISYDKPWAESEPEELLRKIRLSGSIDRNGSVHARLIAARGGTITTLIINTLTTEPYCSADTRLCIEQAEKVFAGAAICAKIIGAVQCRIVVSEKRPQITEAMAPLLVDERFKNFELVKIQKAKYPLHEERLIVRPFGGACVNTAVVSAAAAAAVRDAIVELMPSCQRIVTVAGPAIASPRNLLVRIGTPVRALLDACAADYAKTKRVVSGGPLSGTAVQDFETPVTKTMDALLAFDTVFPGEQRHECIGCRRCLAVCPMRLVPSRCARDVQSGNTEDLFEQRAGECIECGCCAYVCPSKINLVHYMAFGKQLLATEQRKGAL